MGPTRAQVAHLGCMGAYLFAYLLDFFSKVGLRSGWFLGFILGGLGVYFGWSWGKSKLTFFEPGMAKAPQRCASEENLSAIWKALDEITLFKGMPERELKCLSVATTNPA